MGCCDYHDKHCPECEICGNKNKCAWVFPGNHVYCYECQKGLKFE